MRPRLKVVFSWVLAAIGFFVGLCALAKFGMWWAPLGDHDQGWLLRWLIFVGIGLFGVGFLVGSLFAPRNPGRAGVIFLVFLPIYGVLPGLSGIAPQEASSVCVCSPHIDCCACMSPPCGRTTGRASGLVLASIAPAHLCRAARVVPSMGLTPWCGRGIPVLNSAPPGPSTATSSLI